MDILPPIYDSVDSNGEPAFNIEFYKQTNAQYLTLTQAKQLFVSLTGFNIISAYNYITGAIYSTVDIACTYFSSQSITTDTIVCNKIICHDIESQSKTNFQPLLFVDGLTLNLSYDTIDNDYYNGLDLMNYFNTHNTKCLLAPNQKLVIYSKSGLSLYFAKNDTTGFKYFKIPKLGKVPDSIKISKS